MFSHVIKTFRLAPVVCVLMALPVSGQEAPRVETRADAAGTELILNEVNTENYPDVAIFATVLADGEPVAGLGADDFKVSEDEVEQSPLVVEAQLPPLSVVVTVDVSGSMSQRMDATRTAASDFVGQLGEDDAAQLVSFQREIATLTPMTTQKDGVSEAIGGLVARGDTALYDALLTSLDLVAETSGRKAVVLLSDGVDDDGTGQPLSTASVDEALKRAAEINVPVFVIGLGTEMDEAVLQRIADETGGRYLPAPETSQLAEVYDSIGTQLSGQYAIRYTSSLPEDGSTRRVDLSSGDLLAAKTYTAPGEPGAEAQAPATTGDCAVSLAITEQRPMLERAADGYERDLISVSQRNDVRVDATDAILGAGEASPPASLDCARESLTLVNALYDDDLIEVSQRNTLREPATQAMGDLCTAEGELKALEACLMAYRDFYDDNLIEVSTRNTLIEALIAPYTDALAELDEPDAALERINRLYDMNAISVSTRNDIRDTIGQRFLTGE